MKVFLKSANVGKKVSVYSLAHSLDSVLMMRCYNTGVVVIVKLNLVTQFQLPWSANYLNVVISTSTS